MSQAFAGSLREQIALDRPSAERNALGLQQSGWEEIGRCRASIVQEGFGSESEGQALSAMPRYRITTRRRSDVAVGFRVRWRGRLMMIRQVNDDPRFKDRLSLRCEEVRQ
jgi:head-tail adaptor